MIETSTHNIDVPIRKIELSMCDVELGWSVTSKTGARCIVGRDRSRGAEIVALEHEGLQGARVFLENLSQSLACLRRREVVVANVQLDELRVLPGHQRREHDLCGRERFPE